MAQRTKSLPKPMAEHLAKLVKGEVARRFPTPPGAKKGPSQATIAKGIGIVQPVYSEIISAKGGVGVGALLALREWLGKPIDELLGLPPLPSQLKAGLLEVLETFEAQQAAKRRDGRVPPEPDTEPDKA